MAKKSWIARNKKKARAVAKYAAKRAELKAAGDYEALSQLPRNASPVRVVNRCELTGRRHGFIRKFGLSRIAFREAAVSGLIPGVTKSELVITMDTVADMLTCVRNANQALKPNVVVRHSKLKENIARILKQEGYVRDYSVSGDETTKKRELQIDLKFKARKGVIAGLKRVSKPGLRQYVAVDEIPRVLGGLGVAILSTPKGVLTGQEARDQKVGGEVLAHVW